MSSFITRINRMAHKYQRPHPAPCATLSHELPAMHARYFLRGEGFDAANPNLRITFRIHMTAKKRCLPWLLPLHLERETERVRSVRSPRGQVTRL